MNFRRTTNEQSQAAWSLSNENELKNEAVDKLLSIEIGMVDLFYLIKLYIYSVVLYISIHNNVP